MNKQIVKNIIGEKFAQKRPRKKEIMLFGAVFSYFLFEI